MAKLLTSALTVVQQRESQVLMFDDILAQLALPTLSEDCFNASTLPDHFVLSGQAQGRGTTYFIDSGNARLVLRHYRRGGLIRKLSEDGFIFTGLSRTRPYQELTLLKKMRDWQLPCPTPIGGRVQRHGLTWQGDILTERIANATDAHQRLLKMELTAIEWRHIGATIKRFHQRQIYHHDLNIHNIMLDSEGQAWLIDFDKCALKRGEKWKIGNLRRLLRSLNKENELNSDYGFSPHNWQMLVDGYQGT